MGLFLNQRHIDAFKEALEMSDAVLKGGIIDPALCASLYIITGIEGMWERAKEFVIPGWIDFDQLLRMPVSSGERVMLELAGNLDCGRYFERYTPSSIITKCDIRMVDLAVVAIWMRSRIVTTKALLGS